MMREREGEIIIYIYFIYKEFIKSNIVLIPLIFAKEVNF